VIRSFTHKGLEQFFRTGSKAGINPAFASKLEVQLTALNRATKPGEMAVPGWDLHPLKGNLTGHWSIKVNGNWRMTFRFVGEDAEVVDLQDYH
jgi:proteic killer suppression protein